jgi:hypothetical protein
MSDPGADDEPPNHLGAAIYHLVPGEPLIGEALSAVRVLYLALRTASVKLFVETFFSSRIRTEV